MCVSVLCGLSLTRGSCEFINHFALRPNVSHHKLTDCKSEQLNEYTSGFPSSRPLLHRCVKGLLLLHLSVSIFCLVFFTSRSHLDSSSSQISRKVAPQTGPSNSKIYGEIMAVKFGPITWSLTTRKPVRSFDTENGTWTYRCCFFFLQTKIPESTQTSGALCSLNRQGSPLFSDDKNFKCVCVHVRQTRELEQNG